MPKVWTPSLHHQSTMQNFVKIRHAIYDFFPFKIAAIRNYSSTNFIIISQMVMKILRFISTNINTNMCRQAKFYQNRPNNFGDITIFGFWRWPPSPMLNFQIVKYLVHHQIRRRTKFHQNHSNSCCDKSFYNFQNGGIHHRKFAEI